MPKVSAYIPAAEEKHIESFKYTAGSTSKTLYAGDVLDTTTTSTRKFSNVVCKSGYIFDHWKIYEQSQSATPKTSTDSTYSTSTSNDIWVFPYAKETADWTRVTASKTDIGSGTVTCYNSSLSSGDVLRLKLTFAQDCYVPFTVTIGSSGGAYAWLTDSSDSTLDYDTGCPDGYDESDRIGYINSSGTFTFNSSGAFSHELEEGATYYLWLRAYTPSKSMGSVKVVTKVAAPITWDKELIETYNFGEGTNRTTSQDAENYVLQYYKITFSTSGTMTAALEISTSYRNSYLYLTTSTSFDEETGQPTRILEECEDGQSLSYDVSSGTSYYLWVRKITQVTSSLTYNIRVELEKKEPEYDYISKSLGTISDSYFLTQSLDEMLTIRYSMTFPENGHVKFYTTGDEDTYGYIGVTSGFDYAKGEPTSSLDEDDDGGERKELFN